jgi:hypothetical protein
LKGPGPLIIINDDDDGPGDALTEDLSAHIRGSATPITYGDPDPADENNDNVLDVDLDETELEVSVSLNAAGAPENTAPTEAYAIQNFSVLVTDSDGATETLPIRARRNREPNAGSNTTGQDATAANAVVVGTQPPEEAPASALDCPAANSCGFLIDLFTDDDGAEELAFSAVSDKDALRIISIETDEMDKTHARLVVIGVTATPNDTTNDDPVATFEGVTVTVTATDQGGKSKEGKVYLMVNGAPEPKGTISTVPLTQSNTPVEDAVTNLDAFFNDPEKGDLTYSVESSDEAIASATPDNGGTGSLDITPHNIGTAMLTVTAKEPELNNNDADGQTATQTFMVEVKAR